MGVSSTVYAEPMTYQSFISRAHNYVLMPVRTRVVDAKPEYAPYRDIGDALGGSPRGRLMSVNLRTDTTPLTPNIFLLRRRFSTEQLDDSVELRAQDGANLHTMEHLLARLQDDLGAEHTLLLRKKPSNRPQYTWFVYCSVERGRSPILDLPAPAEYERIAALARGEA